MLQMENFVLSYVFVVFYCVHIHLFLSICLLVDTSCFCILTIVNDAKNIGLHVSFQVNFFSPDI